MDSLTWTTFPGQAERLTSNQMVSSEKALPAGTNSQSFSLGLNGRGPKEFN